jgi:hypothetical protein
MFDLKYTTRIRNHYNEIWILIVGSKSNGLKSLYSTSALYPEKRAGSGNHPLEAVALGERERKH